ncbi:hypothetical protein ACKWTF_007648 [Chironomus riparius]
MVMPPKHQPQQPLPKRKNLELSKDEEEVSNLEIFQLIEKMRTENKQGIDSMNNELGAKITAVQSSITDMQERIGGMEDKIEQGTAKADEAIKLAYQNKAALNLISQSMLQNKLEISGSNLDANIKGEELKQKVKELIESFGITLSDQEIVQAFQRPRKNNAAPVIVVEFNNLDTKLMVLQARKQFFVSKIYFNNCLTPLNRFLMYKARETAKEKNFRVFLSGDQIHVKKDNDTKLIINDISDIETIKSWIPNGNESTPKYPNNTPSTSQSNA